MAAPAVARELGAVLGADGAAFVFGADGIEVNVLNQLAGVAVGLDEMGFEAALKEVSASAVAAVESDAVGGLEPAGSVGEVGAGCLEEEVIMVVHQAVAVDDETEAFCSLFEGLKEAFAVGNVAVDVTAFVSTSGDVVDSIFEFDADGSCRGV